MALAEQALGTPRVAGGPLGAGLDGAEGARPGRLRSLGAGATEPFGGGGEPALHLAQLLLELAGALAGGGAAAVDVEGQRPELGAEALQPRLQLGDAIGETGLAHGDPLSVAAQAGEKSPGEGALAVALGEALLGGPAASAHFGQPALDPLLDRSRLAGDLLRRRKPLLAEAKLLRDHLRSQLQLLALDSRAQLGRLGLALQRAQPRARLALDVEGPIEVLPRRLQLQLGTAPALSVLAEPSRLLDQHPPLPGLRVDDRLDPPLTDHRVHLPAHVRVREDFDNVYQAAAGAVQPVGALAGTVEPSLDRDLREIGRRPALGVVDHDLNLGAAAAADPAAAG